MDRQRNFSLKPTRLLLFSFTISSSIAFLTFFTIWLFNLTPSVLKDSSFEFNKTLFGVGLRPLSVQSLTRNVSVSGLKNPVLMNTSFKKPENTSGFGSILRISNESETVIQPIISKNVEDKKFRGIFSEVKNETFKTKVEVLSKKSDLRHSRVTSMGRSRVLNKARIEEMSNKDCDFTKGSWVYDESYPLYNNNTCPFIDEGFDCVGNGRPDKDYMKWRWKPQDCDIPRFNATKMLNLIRGKRLVFVGDSINRNQWESMLCLLMGAVKDPTKVYQTRGRKITKGKGNYSFRFVDYKCSVEYYLSHFLVHESQARVGQKRVQTLRVDAIDRGTSRWRGADILIFNTAHWWSHSKTKAGRALVTWGAWVDRYINRRKTRVFFRSSAPSHFSGGQWNSGGHCTEATQPLNETSKIGSSDKNAITEEIIRNMKTTVTLLNITRLSEFRIDGHPSTYGIKPENRHRSRIQDCSHWCLPGTPDTWNELLYFHLLTRTVDKI